MIADTNMGVVHMSPDAQESSYIKHSRAVAFPVFDRKFLLELLLTDSFLWLLAIAVYQHIHLHTPMRQLCFTVC
jgi:hypothetical protein